MRSKSLLLNLTTTAGIHQSGSCCGTTSYVREIPLVVYAADRVPLWMYLVAPSWDYVVYVMTSSTTNPAILAQLRDVLAQLLGVRRPLEFLPLWVRSFQGTGPPKRCLAFEWRAFHAVSSDVLES